MEEMREKGKKGRMREKQEMCTKWKMRGGRIAGLLLVLCMAACKGTAKQEAGLPEKSLTGTPGAELPEGAENLTETPDAKPPEGAENLTGTPGAEPDKTPDVAPGEAPSEGSNNSPDGAPPEISTITPAVTPGAEPPDGQDVTPTPIKFPTGTPNPRPSGVPTATPKPTPTRKPKPPIWLTETPSGTRWTNGEDTWDEENDRTGNTAQTGQDAETETNTGTGQGAGTETNTETGQDVAFITIAPEPQNTVQTIAGTMTWENFPAVDGSTATIPLSEAVYCLATGQDAEAAKTAIKHTKTTNSYKRLYNKEVDLLIVYEPSGAIIERMQEEPLTIKPIGLDALVFMANAANPVQSLTGEQLLEIYSGNVSDWAEVGGKKQELLAFQRPEGSGSQTLMQKLVMGDTPMARGDNIYRYSTMADILEGMLNFTGDDNTLGYSVYYYASQMYHLPDLKFMGVDGVIPSTRTIYDGSYPYINAFYAVIRPDEPKDSNAHRIFDWLTGPEGQQMVLDLGYVPVIMPDGAKIADGMAVAGSAEEIELSPTADLEEGQHFIFFQKQNVSNEYSYGKVVVYDHKWNKCVTFYNAMTNGRGVWDGRYLSVSQYRPKPNRNEDEEGARGEEYISRIYDLQKQCFLEEEWLEDAWLLDPVLGYFAREATEEEHKEKDRDGYREWGKIYNAQGKVVLDDIPMYEGSIRMNKTKNCYQLWDDKYIRTDENSWKGYSMYYIYDSDFRLKRMICSDEEIMPDAKDRQPNVHYSLEQDEKLLTGDGDLLLDAEIFLGRFGDGKDMECEMLPVKYDGYSIEGDTPEKLYAFRYKGKHYYTDCAMRFLWVEGEKNGTSHAKKGEELPYYFAAENVGENGKNYYFFPDGRPVLMKDGTMPDQVLGYGDGYALVQIGTEAVTVEEHLPKENFVATYQYPAPNAPEKSNAFQIYYFGSHGFLVRDRVAAGNGLAGKREEVRAYQGEKETARYTAENISVTGEYCWNHSTEEGLWLKLDGGVQVELEAEQDRNETVTTQKLYLQRYGFLREGGLSFLTGEAVLENASDGYLQVTAGNYDIVYDADGNIVLRAMNRMLEQD